MANITLTLEEYQDILDRLDALEEKAYQDEETIPEIPNEETTQNTDGYGI